MAWLTRAVNTEPREAGVKKERKTAQYRRGSFMATKRELCQGGSAESGASENRNREERRGTNVVVVPPLIVEREKSRDEWGVKDYKRLEELSSMEEGLGEQEKEPKLILQQKKGVQ